MQHAIGAYNCQKAIGDGAGIPVAQTAVIPAAPAAPGHYDSIGISIVNGLVDPSTIMASAPHGRSTSNCAFDGFQGITYSTLGTCLRCRDVSSAVKVSRRGKDGLNVNGTNWPINMLFSLSTEVRMSLNTSTFNISTTAASIKPLDHAAGDGEALMSSVNVITLTDAKSGGNDFKDNSDPSPVLPSGIGLLGARCDFYPCLKNISGRIMNGVLEEEVITTIPVYFKNESAERTLGNTSMIIPHFLCQAKLPAKCPYELSQEVVNRTYAGLSVERQVWVTFNICIDALSPTRNQYLVDRGG